MEWRSASSGLAELVGHHSLPEFKFVTLPHALIDHQRRIYGVEQLLAALAQVHVLDQSLADLKRTTLNLEREL
jgi:hypothetical protein